MGQRNGQWKIVAQCLWDKKTFPEASAPRLDVMDTQLSQTTLPRCYTDCNSDWTDQSDQSMCFTVHLIGLMDQWCIRTVTMVMEKYKWRD